MQHPASYRDPAGFVFLSDGIVYRSIAKEYITHYQQLRDSGLYQHLVKSAMMLPFEEVGVHPEPLRSDHAVTIRPEQLSFWSYPSEWCFEQLQEAAMLTLRLCQDGIKHGMILKDATPANIQFISGKAVLIDSLSFEIYTEGKPWIAMSQFCRMMLYPLLAQTFSESFDSRMLLAFPEGIDARMLTHLVPFRKRFSVLYQLYVFLPASLNGKKGGANKGAARLSKAKLLHSFEQLSNWIKGLRPKAIKSVWNDYYEETILSKHYLEAKEILIERILAEIKPSSVTDIGANTGAFSKIAARYAQRIIALDSDERSVAGLHLLLKEARSQDMNVLYADLCHPTPATGFNNAETIPLLSRIRSHTCLALALVHHIAIAKNVPFSKLAMMLSRITEAYLIIEFVPKTDPRVEEMLRTRTDIFQNYTQANFEEAFTPHFTVESQTLVPSSERTLYLLRRRS